MKRSSTLITSDSETNPILKGLEDKSFVMTIFCNDCYKYYNSLKQICIVGLIITSSSMVILNSYESKSAWIQYINIVMNTINIFIITFQSKFEIIEKTKIYFDLSNQFNTLHNDIIDKVTLKRDNDEFINESTLKYNNLQTNVKDFPENIRKKIIERFKSDRTLPNNLLSIFDNHVGSFVFRRERTNSRINFSNETQQGVNAI